MTVKISGCTGQYFHIFTDLCLISNHNWLSLQIYEPLTDIMTVKRVLSSFFAIATGIAVSTQYRSKKRCDTVKEVTVKYREIKHE